MRFRQIASILVIVLIGGLVVACGRDSKPTPTPVPSPTVAETAIPASTTAVTPVASPVSMVATSAAAVPTTTPGEVATSEPDTTSVAEVTATDSAKDDDALPATPQAAAVAPTQAPSRQAPENMIELTGTLMLEGRPQRDYTFGDTGCIGLGEWRALKPGTQVVVRNASGTVVDIATLEDEISQGWCVWRFSIFVPEDEFFGVSIPMVMETWFAPDDASVQSGEIRLVLP